MLHLFLKNTAETRLVLLLTDVGTQPGTSCGFPDVEKPRLQNRRPVAEPYRFHFDIDSVLEREEPRTATQLVQI